MPHRKTKYACDGTLFEFLEARLVLAGSPFPTIGELETPSNTVVRFETNFGDIDIELFDTEAPTTVQNFLDHVRDGDYDHTFFHRLAFLPGDDPFVLQGGGFRFTNKDGAAPIPTEDPIANEFGRSNVERTIAMAKLGGDPDSATSQWFINLNDNSENLDDQNGGFTVFARVATDASWNVVQTIIGLDTINVGSPFNELPVGPSFTSELREDTLVFINDAEVIKRSGQQQFYTERVYYPEGFSGSTINEFLPMGNPNTQLAWVQVIARAEVDPANNGVDFDGWFRDRVIFEGFIAPRSRGGITISRFMPGTGEPNPDDLLPQGVPYALEVQSTVPISANLSHFDFGSATGESFTNALSEDWAFGRGSKNTNGQFEFLVWQNPNPQAVQIDITFLVEGGPNITRSFATDSYRRGGLAFNNIEALDNLSSFGILVNADAPIVAALTQFDNRDNATRGASARGQSGDASEVGVIPLVNVGTDADHIINILNPSTTSAIVDLTLQFNDARPDRKLTAALVVAPQTRAAFDLGAVSGLENPDRFTVVYESNVGVYASSLHTDRFVIDEAPITDTTGFGLPSIAATGYLFAEGFIDPARAGKDVFEFVTIYNPNSDLFGVTDAPATVTLTLYYTDGFELSEARNVAAGERVDFDLHALASVLEQGADNDRFFYSLEVTSDVPVVVQMTHLDLTLGDLQPSGGFATLGTAFGSVVRLDDL